MLAVRAEEGASQRRWCHPPATVTGMEWCAKGDVHQRNTMINQVRPTGGAPDPLGLAVAQEMQERLRPAEVILLGSRAAGDHRPDSDVDLMAVCPGEDAAREVNRTVRELLEGKHGAPVVNVTTVTKGEFVRTAPLGQSHAGQAVRHGVTPHGKPLDYRPERGPEPEEIRREATFWLVLAELHLGAFSRTEGTWLAGSHIPALDAQTALERTFKGLLAAGNDGTRFRRDATLMWRHIKDTGPITDQKGAEAVENLLAATMEPEGGCSLARFTEAWRRGGVVPDPTEAERQALTLRLAPAANALVAEALARAGATRDDMEQERNRRRGAAGRFPGRRKWFFNGYGAISP